MINMNITKITPNAEVTILFSEQLMDIKKLESKGINMTVLNLIKDQVLNISYYCNV